MQTIIKIGQRSDVGRIRSINEDRSCAITYPAVRQDIDAFLAVADGIGGHRSGEVASHHVISMLCERFSSKTLEERQESVPKELSKYQIILEEAIGDINQELYALGSSNEELGGIGTTIVAAMFVGSVLIVSHVGDSRAYLVRQEKIEQLTKDHSWIAEQVRAGLLEPENAHSHPMKNVITRTLGTRPNVKLDTQILKLLDKDIIVLCTDGLTNMVSDEEILREVVNCEIPDQACQALVELANERGGTDNITVVAAQYEDWHIR